MSQTPVPFRLDTWGADEITVLSSRKLHPSNQQVMRSAVSN